MRINIDTGGKIISDRDVRSLYLLVFAIENMSSKRMRYANLAFTADRLGYKLIPKEPK